MGFGIGSAIAGAAAKAVDQGINLWQYKKSLGLSYDQMNMQREFAQNGIRWRVADAKAAGIHPLVALGAPTLSASGVAGPQQTGTDFASMGQSFERAKEAKALEDERQLNSELVKANIRKVNAETDFVQQQANNSKESVAKSGLPPAMALANQTTPNMDNPIKSYGWLKDERGKIVGIVPSEDAKSRTEDTLGVEWVPWVGATARNFMAKVFGQEVDGMHWHGQEKGFLPYPPKKKKGFFDYARDARSFYRDYD